MERMYAIETYYHLADRVSLTLSGLFKNLWHCIHINISSFNPAANAFLSENISLNDFFGKNFFNLFFDRLIKFLSLLCCYPIFKYLNLSLDLQIISTFSASFDSSTTFSR